MFEPPCDSASVVVTGAASGIGYATVALLASAGYRVVALDIDEAGLEKALATLPGNVLGCPGDVADWGAHERAADLAAANGTLWGWVNNAGIDVRGSAHEVTAEEITRGVRVLQLGAMFGSAVATRRMLAGSGGSIVNVSSIQAVVSFPAYYVYGAAKAALIMATKSIAVDYAPHGIRCNAVLPGTVDTPMLDEVMPRDVPRDEALRQEGLLSPTARVASPNEVAEAIAFLLSTHSSYISGAALPVDGASTARCFAYPPLPRPPAGQ